MNRYAELLVQIWKRANRVNTRGEWHVVARRMEAAAKDRPDAADTYNLLARVAYSRMNMVQKTMVGGIPL